MLNTLQDIILFEAILSDLFPTTQLPTPDQQEFTAALADSCKALGLQPGDQFVGKAMQLHDTLGVRFGVMLVGPAGMMTGVLVFYKNTCLSFVSMDSRLSIMV